MPAKKETPRYVDPELEKFFRQNKEMVEKLLAEESEKAIDAMEKGNISAKDFAIYHAKKAKETAEAEKEIFEEFARYKKKKADDLATGLLAMMQDPDVQKHFATAGLELLMAFDALVKAAPIPDEFKKPAEKASQAAKTAGTAKKTTGTAAGKTTGSAPKKPTAKKVQIK